MSLVIQTNIAMINAQNNYKVVTGKKAKSAEALGTGYRINRAADDAAGLTISEKMRWQIRGLERGERNGQDGISWVQTGDQALAEVHDMIHRMRELTIQALNDTNTPEDRAALQAEFDAIQSEIDRITKSTQFNTLNIFEEHEPSFYELEGNVKWPQNGLHTVNVPDNKLIVEFKRSKDAPPETVTIEVPQGTYTTQELADEIDSALMAIPEEDLVMEYSEDGTFNLCVEGGNEISSATGGLSYLLYEMYEGGSVGSLIGTTVFAKEGSRLEIVTGKNDNLSFNIEDFNGNVSSKSITIPQGEYTRKQLIDIFNNELAGTDISAVAYGTGIKLTSNEKIITGFKGNMFKIDEGLDVYSSVFYDNVKYGNISMTAGTFTGGAVIPTNQKDKEHEKFKIDSVNLSNNTLTFEANGSKTPVSIVIPDGEYTVDEMVDKLNSLFEATLADSDTSNDLKLVASKYTNNAGTYKGIVITSLIKGGNSKVGIDSNSSAYNTLFVDRKYNQYNVENASFYTETKADTDAIFTGAKTLSGANIPLKVITGQNDSFKIGVGNDENSLDEYTIKLTKSEYNSVDEIVSDINAQISLNSGISGKVTASANNGKIILTETSGLKYVKALNGGTNIGFDDLFVKKTIEYTTVTTSGKGTITLNNPLTPGTVIDGTNKELNIKVNGSNYKINLPEGTVGTDISYADIEKAINDTIVARTQTTDNTFVAVDDTGDVVSHTFNDYDEGNTDVNYQTYSNTGDSRKAEGSADAYVYNTPANVTLKSAMPSSVKIDDSNKNMFIKINGVTKTITLDEGTYSANQLTTALQNKIDEAYGKYDGGAKVYLDSTGKLTFEARLNTADGGVISGSNTSISFSVSSSPLMKELHTTRTPAKITTGNMLNTINITDDTNTFQFQYKKDGVLQNVTLNLTKGTYSQSGIVAEINKQLKAQGIEVTAKQSGSAIEFTTAGVGNKYYLSYSKETGGTSAEAIFGPLQTEYPAKVTIERDTLSEINIGSTNNQFTLNINGNDETVTLDNGVYNRDQLVEELNDKLNTKGVAVSLDPNQKRLVFETTAKGNSASIAISYSNGGSAMKAIYGTTTINYPGVTATFTGDNKLKLTASDANATLSVESEQDGLLQADKETEIITKPTATEGYTSVKVSYVDGVNITEPVVIDNWNDELKFNYKHNGVTYPVNISVTQGTYNSFDDLKNELQSKIDVALTGTPAAGALSVSVNGNGVRIEAVNPGKDYEIVKSSFSGDFYDKVLCKTVERNYAQSVETRNGNKPSDTAYTIGRKDVKNTEVQIKTGINDTLTIDFTYGGNTKTLTMTLDAGSYRGESLVDMIQDKLNEQLVAADLEENMILVGIGDIRTGVIGANDDKALNFSLSRDANLPAEGTYILDGVRGNAAFSVFYQTDGELIPAYTKGAKDISDGVTINPGEEVFSFDVDGQTYDITLAAGDYTAEEVVNEINAQLTTAPVKAEIDDGKLKISYEKLGEHTINNVRGGAMEELFFVQNSDDKEETGILIQLSSQQGDSVEIDKPIIGTVALKINSAVITKPKYANKTLERLDYALEEVSEARIMFGAMQNRLEHIIKNNSNTAENVQRSESIIRDTDMAEEMVDYSKHNILQQVGQSMMAQIKVGQEGVLKLLQ